MENRYNEYSGIIINGYNFREPDGGMQVSLNFIDEIANRNGAGAISKIITKNAIANYTLNWSKLNAYEMMDLCKACRINIQNKDEGEFNILTENERIGIIKSILPCGIRTYEVYFGSTLTATMITAKTFDKDFELIDGKWEDYIWWQNVTLEVIGVGSKK